MGNASQIIIAILIVGAIITYSEFIAPKRVEQKSQDLNITELQKLIHEQINIQRRSYGLKTLNYDERLTQIATEHSKDMIERQFFDHINPDGEDPTDRGLRAGYECVKNYGTYYESGLAENLFQNNLFDSVTYTNGIPSYDWNTLEKIAETTVNRWMNSLGHRQNILTPTFRVEGLGIASASEGQVYITQIFC